MLCNRLIAKTDVLCQINSQAVGAWTPSSPPFLPPLNEEEGRAHDDSTRLRRGDGRIYFYTKDSNLLIDRGGAKSSPFKSLILALLLVRACLREVGESLFDAFGLT